MALRQFARFCSDVITTSRATTLFYDRISDTESEMLGEFNAPTIFPFLVHGRGGTLTSHESRTIYQALNEDTSARLQPASSKDAWHVA